MRLIKIGAPWCGQCTVVENTLIRIKKELDDRNVQLVKVDADSDPEGYVNRFQIRNIPVLIIVNDQDQELKRLRGVVSAEQILNTIDELKADGNL